MSSKTATLIRNLSDDLTEDGRRVWAGDARAYRLSPAADFTEVVVVSAATLPVWEGIGGGEETFIFPAVENPDGAITVTSWLEMDGSYRGGLDHAKALIGLGYEVVAQ